MPKISVIVPVYKAEKYLRRCVDSILNQTFTDFELILVDDGSPDGSGAICDEYARKDKRIRVFHKENGGVSSARNLGLDNVNGEYVTFVDADDWIDADNMSICMSVMIENNLDMLQYSFKRIDDNGHILQVRNIHTDVLDLPRYIETGNFNMCVWGAYIKNSLIQSKTIRFDEKIKLAEDQMFMMEVMSMSRRLQSIDSVFYNYCFNLASATNNEKTNDMILSSYRCIEFKHEYPLFANRMDDLVLFFVEKLIVRCRYDEVFNILNALKPTYYRQRPWPSVCMAYVSQYNVCAGVAIGGILYPMYCAILKFASRVKHKINQESLCQKLV